MKTEKHEMGHAGRTEGDRLAKIPHTMAFSQMRDVLLCRLFLREPFCRSRSRLRCFSVFLSVQNRRFCCRGTQRDGVNGSRDPFTLSLWIRNTEREAQSVKCVIPPNGGMGCERGLRRR